MTLNLVSYKTFVAQPNPITIFNQNYNFQMTTNISNNYTITNFKFPLCISYKHPINFDFCTNASPNVFMTEKNLHIKGISRVCCSLRKHIGAK